MDVRAYRKAKALGAVTRTKCCSHVNEYGAAARKGPCCGKMSGYGDLVDFIAPIATAALDVTKGIADVYVAVNQVQTANAQTAFLNAETAGVQQNTALQAKAAATGQAGPPMAPLPGQTITLPFSLSAIPTPYLIGGAALALFLLID